MLRQIRRLSAVDDIQRLEDPGNVDLHGLLGDAQLLADFLVRQAIAQQSQYINLSLGELLDGRDAVARRHPCGPRASGARTSSGGTYTLPLKTSRRADSTVLGLADLGM
ncbi:MAG: hypothetical protein WDM77_21930 [Steroidobacteraceae bacterium]